MNTVPYLSFTYGALLVLGGAMGASKGSTASLVAGGGSGLAIVATEALLAGGVAAGGARTVVEAVQLTLAGALAYVMGQRFARSGKFMPAGMVATLSAALAVAYAARLAGAGGKPHAA